MSAQSRESGFTLIEVLVASALVVSVIGGFAQLAAKGATQAHAARSAGAALALAQGKLEELRAATWSYDATGAPVSEPALAESPADAVAVDRDGWWDAADEFGQAVSTTDVGRTVYRRRWSIARVDAADPDTLVQGLRPLRRIVGGCGQWLAGRVRLQCAGAEAMNNRGFTLVELLVASAGLLVTMAFVAALAVPLRDGFERSLGAADLTGGSRTVLERLTAEIREAGSGASVGGGRLADVLPPIVPIATLDSATWADPGQAFRVTRVPLLAPQGRLLSDVTAGSVTVTLDTTNRCTAVGAGCGLRPGMVALLYDGARSEVVSVSLVSGGVVRFSAPLTSAYAAGAVLASVSVTAYGLRPAPDGSFRLVRSTGASEQPLLDDVVDFRVRVVGADPLHSRRVELSLRVEAPSAAMRGPAGRFFRRPGTAMRPAAWVPDVEIRTTVSLRNGAG